MTRDRRAGRAADGIFAALVVAGLMAGAAPAAADTPCTATGSPSVVLDVMPGSVRYFADRPQRDLRRMQGGRGLAAEGWEPIGLTVAEFGFELSVSVRAQQASDGRYCAAITEVDATMGYSTIDVYVAREFPRASCQFSAIVDHERRHVVVFQQTLRDYADEVRRTLRASAEAQPAIIARSPREAALAFRNALRRNLETMVRRIGRVLDERNARLDTPQSYAREQENCGSWWREPTGAITPDPS